MSWPWNELGLLGPAELPEIRRAYAGLLKDNHPEEDPEGFQRLHSAYQAACRHARQSGRGPLPESPPDPPQAEQRQSSPFRRRRRNRKPCRLPGNGPAKTENRREPFCISS